MQRVLLVMSEHVQNERVVLEVLDEGGVHRDTHLMCGTREHVKRS